LQEESDHGLATSLGNGEHATDDLRSQGPGCHRRLDHRPDADFGLDTNKAIGDTFGAAGYPVPESHVRMKQEA
jgi:hypothetical protein